VTKIDEKLKKGTPTTIEFTVRKWALFHSRYTNRPPVTTGQGKPGANVHLLAGLRQASPGD
jgi:hypothetical protein